MGPRAKENEAEGCSGVAGEVGGDGGVGPIVGEGGGAEVFGVEAGGRRCWGDEEFFGGVDIEPGIDGLAGEEISVKFSGCEVPNNDVGDRIEERGGEVTLEFVEGAGSIAGAVKEGVAGEGGEGLGESLSGASEHETVAYDNALPVFAGGKGRVVVTIRVGPNDTTGVEFLIRRAEAMEGNGFGKWTPADRGGFEGLV